MGFFPSPLFLSCRVSISYKELYLTPLGHYPTPNSGQFYCNKQYYIHALYRQFYQYRILNHMQILIAPGQCSDTTFVANPESHKVAFSTNFFLILLGLDLGHQIMTGKTRNTRGSHGLPPDIFSSGNMSGILRVLADQHDSVAFI